MKNLFNSVVAVVLFAAATLVAAKPLSITFTADNHYQGRVGLITVNTVAGPALLDVPGPGPFSTQVPGAVNNVVINNYVIFQGQAGTARLADGHLVKVTWGGPNVIIINPEENN